MSKITKKKVEAAIQKMPGFQWVELWYDRSAKQWVFTGGDSALWESTGSLTYRLDMMSVEEWVELARHLSGRDRAGQ